MPGVEAVATYAAVNASTLAILIDALLVRGVLVLAAMRLPGRVAWWAPGPLRTLQRRIGLSETEGERAAAESGSVPISSATSES